MAIPIITSKEMTKMDKTTKKEVLYMQLFDDEVFVFSCCSQSFCVEFVGIAFFCVYMSFNLSKRKK